MSLSSEHCISPSLFLFSFLSALTALVSPYSLTTFYIIICWQMDICSQITHPNIILISSTAYLSSFQDIKVPPEWLIDISVSKIIPFHNCSVSAKGNSILILRPKKKNLGAVLGTSLSHPTFSSSANISVYVFNIYPELYHFQLPHC